MSKIDDFIKKRLEDQAQLVEDWSTPSEKMWEEAFIHFPKKKKRRGFVFWLFGGSLILLFLPLAWMYSANFNLAEKHIIASTALKESIQQNAKPTNESSSENENISDSDPLSSNTLRNKIDSQAFARDEKKPISNSNDLKKNNSFKEEDLSRNSFKTNNSIAKNEENLYVSNEITKPNVNAEAINQHGSKPNLAHVEKHLFPLSKSRTSINIESLNTLNFKWEEKHAFELENPTKFITILPKRAKNELGISHAFTQFSFMNSFDITEDPEIEEIIASIKYKNINVHYAKFLGNRWSVSEDLLFSSLDLDFEFSTFITYDNTVVENTVNQKYDTVNTRNKSQTDNEVEIEYIEGKAPQLGDLLEVRGDLNLNLSAIQLPIMLNHHFRKKRFEYIIGAGASLDYVFLNISGVDVEIYKEDELISKPSNIQGYHERFWEYSLYIHTGIRYHFHSNFNMGLNLRYAIIDPDLSGLELGFYYRW